MEEKKVESGLGRRLRRVIKSRGQSLRSFSEKSGVPYRTLQNYLSGSMKPNSEQFEKIARAGIDINYLLTGEACTPLFWKGIGEKIDEEAYAILADQEILAVVQTRVNKAANFILSEHIKDGSSLTFELMLDIYCRLSANVLLFIVKADIPFEDARKLGMSLDRLLASALDVAMEAAAMKLAAQMLVSTQEAST